MKAYLRQFFCMFLAVVSLAGFESVAEAAAKFRLASVVNMAQMNTKLDSGGSSSSASGLGYGGGMFVDVFAAKALGVNVGALYEIRNVTDEKKKQQALPYLSMPMTINIWAGNVFHFGGGVYLNQMLDKAKADELQIKKSELGWTAGTGLDVPMGKSAQFTLEGRVQKSILDTSAVLGKARYFSEYQVLLGLAFGGYK